MPSVACRGPVTDPIRPQQKWKDEGHNHDLPNLHADVESRERGHSRIRWQPDLLQRAGEAEAVNEPENERHPPATVHIAREKILDRYKYDRRGDRRFDDGTWEYDNLQRSKGQRDRVSNREGGDDLDHRPQTLRPKQDRGKERDVSGAEKELLDTGLDEPPDDLECRRPAPDRRPRALRCRGQARARRSRLR